MRDFVGSGSELIDSDLGSIEGKFSCFSRELFSMDSLAIDMKLSQSTDLAEKFLGRLKLTFDSVVVCLLNIFKFVKVSQHFRIRECKIRKNEIKNPLEASIDRTKIFEPNSQLHGSKKDKKIFKKISIQ